ncbi:hypothetical protein E2562_027625 [Oryza meyeriana var. granulata]|uniref:Pentatricopeptide repeat-containing protein n=1 Tax=Oryza meyeriana var. granulata TaxID=110450 RepID=A0A6G1E2G6_9ORYZ|nr:hypothetical protein E2562_027625 [Oryza meyeriana var. granulata]
MNLGGIMYSTLLHARLLVSSSPDDLRLRLVLLRSYAARGDFASARRLLEEAPPRPASPLLYNALIRAHARRLDLRAALALFARMRRSAATAPDAHTFACVLRACVDRSRPDAARIVNGIVVCSGMSSHPIIGSALVSAYSKLGPVADARRVFDGLPDPDLVIWNSMMSGYGYRGMCHDGLDLFSAMRRAGEQPDGYSMVSLVSSFGNREALPFGQAIHGVCIKGVISNLGSHGFAMKAIEVLDEMLREAYDLIQMMPVPPDSGVWGALLWGCCVHRDSSLGRIVAEKLFELYPDKASYRVMLSNLYASQEMWWDAEETYGASGKRIKQGTMASSYITAGIARQLTSQEVPYKH